jgi:hypothetical protein
MKKTVKRSTSLCTLALTIGLTCAQAACADIWQPLEQWRIHEGRIAPWAKPDTPIDPRYRGQEIRFQTKRVLAPHPLACEDATYEWTFGDAGGLFEGGLPEPAATAARELGLGPEPIATLRVTCMNAGFDFHRTRDGDLLIGLDNVVWTLRAARPASTPAEIVQELLLAHFTHDMGFTRESIAQKSQSLSADLRTRIDRYLSTPQSPDQAPELNGDPFTDSQEYPRRFSLGPIRTDAERIIVPVMFGDSNAQRGVDYVLVSECDRWVVDDLVDERGQSLRELLGTTAAKTFEQFFTRFRAA